MAIYRTANNGVRVRLDSRTVEVSGFFSPNVLAATARAENGGEPIDIQDAWMDDDGMPHRRYHRVQQQP